MSAPQGDLVRVLIITPDGTAVDRVRELGSGMLHLPDADLMKTPLSPTGEPPATHWVCKNVFPVEVARKMAAHPVRHGTEIIVDPREKTAELLARRGLKRIAERPPKS